MKGNFFLAVFVCLFLISNVAAQSVLKINEAKTRVVLHDTSAELLLVVENPQTSFDGVMAFELLDVKDAVRLTFERREKIKSGRETYNVSLPLYDLLEKNSDEIGWFRLRYRIAGDDRKTLTEGVISLSEILKDVFELRVIASENIAAGMSFRARVRASQPFSGAPVKNVKIKGEITLDLDTEAKNDELKISAKGETDAEGAAILEFKIPPNAKLDDDADLKITGVKYGIEREVEEDLRALTDDYSVYLNADKPLYQPGQSFNARGILMKTGIGQNTVVGNSALKFVITDEDDTVLYRETVTTSRFGVASVAWQIPDNAKLGNYRVVVESDEDLSRNRMTFKVSRYELPNFTVAAKADRDFYLPQNTSASVEVRADYLFGKPVVKGTVKIVQESERDWNYREQKWEIKEEREFTGETDANGVFTAKIDLTKAHIALGGRDYNRYNDLNFAAYFTDATTNRTEQRRFDLRLSKEAVHVYLIGETYNGNPNLPQTFYVSTFYADGSSAVCDVEVTGNYENESNQTAVARLKTNRYGAGKLEYTAPRFGNAEKDLQLKITATDDKQQFGTLEEKIDFDAGDALQIRTKKTIYKPGESLRANIFSTVKDALVYVDVVRDWTVIASQTVRLKDGRAAVKIPFQAGFKGGLTIAAYAETIDKDGDTDLIKDSHGVIYPAPNNLKLDATFSQAVYRPNEEARIVFDVLAADKKPLESALGIVVFDQAIEERARTDADFGGGGNLFDGYNDLLGYEDRFGQLTRRDLDEIDTSKMIPDDLQTAAEVMFYDDYYPNISRSQNTGQAQSIFADYFKKQLAPVETALKNAYLNNYEHPTDDASLLKILDANAIDFSNLRDPWAMNYRAEYEIKEERDLLKFVSAGADKKFDTADDFSVLGLQFQYFMPFGTAVNRAVKNYHERAKSFIRDEATLKTELAKQNVNLDALRDRWNRQYRIEFDVDGRNFVIRFHSLGANGFYETETWNTDDFDVWTNEIDYFTETENRIQEVLSDYAKRTKTYPKDAESFRQILKETNDDAAQILDGYARPAYLTANVYSRYSDKVKIENTGAVGEKPTQKTTVEPVMQEIAALKLRSAGADSKEGTEDDFDLAVFSGVVSEQGKSDKQPKAQVSIVVSTGAKGAIRGTIRDPNGAVVPNVVVTAVDAKNEETEYSATSNDEGFYVIENLPSGNYKVSTSAANGFSTTILENVLVRAKSITEADLSLQVAGATMTVDVTAGVSSIETSSSTISSNGRGMGSGGGGGGGRKEEEKVSENKSPENSTPRLREYFPETLLWQPELITNKNGRAELKFKLGDNLTTWKMYAIASDANGKIGIAEREIKTFQPFFADLEPPKFLTVGDEISLPVQIRNYTEKAQTVDVKMASGDWFNFLDAADKTAGKKIEVAANDSQNAVFAFRADKITKDGKQRVTAFAGKDSDAIEKSVTVKPNGKEIVKTQSEIFRESAAFDVNFPANALPQTARATLKIYPNLLAHVAESIEGLLQRPDGCGEQTVSSTYPNLMIMKFAPKDSKIYSQAEKYLHKGYERLLGYQTADGGFSVWTKDAPDVALTAYALRFLVDAKAFIEVDDDAIVNARKWLIKQQREDGSWTRKYNWESTEDASRTKLITTYAARTLAMTAKDEAAAKETNQSLQAALSYLKTRNAEIDEPYALALFGLALLDAGNADDAKSVAAKLAAMAISENAGVYWKLETNTPFYGWGTAGRIETTALVVQLLVRIQGSEFRIQDSKIEDLISKGTQFLLKNKDRYGVWYSTQTTINVLDAFLATIGDAADKSVDTNRTAEIFVNNQKLKDVALPPENVLSFPINIELPTSRNANRVEVKIGGNKSALMAQIVQTHYIGWQDFEANGRDENQSRALRLEYKCDKQTAQPTEEISCNVEAERVGFKGYGMLLAEIGLPPGADVDRASLEKAKEENWNFSRYDVLPDKIIVYLWAQAGGTKFNFKFKPRYGINAQTAPSIVYDYYNSEAQATLPPLKFSVKQNF